MNRCIATPQAPKARDSKAAATQAESTAATNPLRFHTGWTHTGRANRAPLERGSSGQLTFGDNRSSGYLAMDSASISALAALSGSVIGGLTSLVATWLSQ